MIINRRRRHKVYFWLTPVILVIISATYLGMVQYQTDLNKQIKLVEPIVQAALFHNQDQQKLEQIDNEGLKQVVTNALTGSDGTYAVVVKNLKTGEHFELNPQKSFESGSLYKLWVMGAVYKAEKNGQLDDNQVLTKSVEDLNDDFQIDPSLAEQTDGVVTFSVHDALYQMITISHNYAALLLTDKIGLSKVAQFINENGFSGSSVGINGDSPQIDAQDIEIFLEKVYKGELIDSNYSQQMLDLLKQQKLNSKIPAKLPADTVIAHKTGEIDDFSHDGGIIYSPKGDYILVVLTESDNPPETENKISDISQAVFVYFNQEKIK